MNPELLNEEQLIEQLKTIDEKLQSGKATIEEANKAIEIRLILSRFRKARKWGWKNNF